MSGKSLFESKRLLIFNLLLVGVLAGFGLAFFLMGPQTLATGVTAAAESRPDALSPSLFELQNSFRAISREVLPSVVEIRTVDVRTVQRTNSPLPDGFPWNWFFGDPRRSAPNDKSQPNEESPDPTPPRRNEQEFRSQGLGSGIMVRRQNNLIYVLTNNHVVGEAREITVRLLDGRDFPAKLVGTDPRKDLALVSFETTAQDLKLAQMGDSSQLQVGDIVFAMGNPLGLEFTVTQGIVSALGRRGGPDGNISDFIQTDASINRGNSGGALVDLRGQVIGINTWIASPSGGNVGLGFAIPINNAKRAIDDFINQGNVRYGWLGVSIQDGDRSLQEALNLGTANGAFIAHVFRGGPADQGGLLPGDFVLSVNGRTIRNSTELTFAIGELAPGQRADMELIRLGQRQRVSVTIAERAGEEAISNQSNQLWPGFAVRVLTEEIRNRVAWTKDLQGLLIAGLVPRSPAAIAGLRDGDVLTQVNGQRVTTLTEFYRSLNGVRQGELRLQFHREGVDLSIGIVR